MKKRIVALLLLITICFAGCDLIFHDDSVYHGCDHKHEKRSVESRVEGLKEHFQEKQSVLENIACSLYEEAEKYPEGRLYADEGVLQLLSKEIKLDDEPIIITSDIAKLIEEYYKKDCLPYLDKSLDIYIDCDQLWTKADICVFSYGRYLDEDDVLTDVDLVYLYDPDVPFTGQDNTEVIKLDKHWRIVVEDFYY